MLLLIFIAYNLISFALLPLAAIYLVYRVIKGKPTIGIWRQRLGLVPRPSTRSTKTVWIHAVSVGEVLSVQSFIKDLENKNITVYLTVGTVSAHTIAYKHKICTNISLMPYDFLPCMLLAYHRIAPTSVMLVEAELWPNFLTLAKIRGAQLFLLNARITRRSEKRYRRFAWFYRKLFHLFDAIYCQSELQRINFKRLGVNPDILVNAGNIKLMNVVEKKGRAKRVPPGKGISKQPTLLVGSLHPGELDVYLNLYNALKSKKIATKIILAPRHFHWHTELLKKIQATGESYAIWDTQGITSSLEHFEPGDLTKKNATHIVRDLSNAHTFVLLCTLGKLFDVYQCADLFFLGGTFVPIGGHNLAEPCVWGVPSVVGPYHENCSEIISELSQNKSVACVSNEEELCASVEHLLSHPQELVNRGQNCQSWLETNAQTVRDTYQKVQKRIIS